MQQYRIASFCVSWWEEVFLTEQDECCEGVLTFLILFVQTWNKTRFSLRLFLQFTLPKLLWLVNTGKENTYKTYLFWLEPLPSFLLACSLSGLLCFIPSRWFVVVCPLSLWKTSQWLWPGLRLLTSVFSLLHHLGKQRELSPSRRGDFAGVMGLLMFW